MFRRLQSNTHITLTTYKLPYHLYSHLHDIIIFNFTFSYSFYLYCTPLFLGSVSSLGNRVVRLCPSFRMLRPFTSLRKNAVLVSGTSGNGDAHSHCLGGIKRVLFTAEDINGSSSGIGHSAVLGKQADLWLEPITVAIRLSR